MSLHGRKSMWMIMMIQTNWPFSAVWWFRAADICQWRQRSRLTIEKYISWNETCATRAVTIECHDRWWLEVKWKLM
jgi:hypothetical protein